jgi:2-iminobutanoate/2-iminopropanoate deaminase
MQEISTDEAPSSIGPFSQGIRDGSTVYVSGQGPIDPESGSVVSQDIEEQTEQTLSNIDAVLTAADGSLDDIVKTTVFVTDMSDYDTVNEVYGTYMSEPYPARSAVQIVELPVDIGVEIEAIARIDTEN